MDASEFTGLSSLTLDRYLLHNDRPPLAAADRVPLLDRLWALIESRGLPPPLARGDRGTPREMAAAEADAAVQALLAGCPRATELAAPVRQLVKACFQPEFRACRGSYRAMASDGSCRRQQLAHARQRLSGTHCVDCPYWTALGPAAHERLLAGQWLAAREEFVAHRDVFLPEDFRALRTAVRSHAHRQATR